MKTIVKVFVIFFLVLAIFGGAAWYAYNVYLKPRKVKRPRTVQKAVPLRDTSATEFERVLSESKTKPRTENIAALQSFLTNFPTSPKVTDARKLLEVSILKNFFPLRPVQERPNTSSLREILWPASPAKIKYRSTSLSELTISTAC